MEVGAGYLFPDGSVLQILAQDGAAPDRTEDDEQEEDLPETDRGFLKTDPPNRETKPGQGDTVAGPESEHHTFKSEPFLHCVPLS